MNCRTLNFENQCLWFPLRRDSWDRQRHLYSLFSYLLCKAYYLCFIPYSNPRKWTSRLPSSKSDLVTRGPGSSIREFEVLLAISLSGHIHLGCVRCRAGQIFQQLLVEWPKHSQRSPTPPKPEKHHLHKSPLSVCCNFSRFTQSSEYFHQGKQMKVENLMFFRAALYGATSGFWRF